MFAPLKHRNFRLYLSGQFVSLIGTWMQQLAVSWLVYRMTGSPLWLGIAMFAAQIPTFLFGLFAGVIVDHANRHKLLIWTQSLAAVEATVLTVLTLTGKINLTELIILELILGTINAFDMPARQAFVVQMIGNRKELPNAIALSSSVVNGTRLVGPAIAGATIALFGEGICFLLNALSYFAVLIALLLMKVEHPDVSRRVQHLFESLKVGFDSAFKDTPIRSVLFLLSFVSLFGMPYLTLFAALATHVPGGGPSAFGSISAAGGCGALIGALYLARRAEPSSHGTLLGYAAFIFPIGLIALSQAGTLHWMWVCVFVSGFGMMILMSGGNAIIQTLVADDRRGRVMSFFIFSLLGVAPFGNLLIGALAQRVGVKPAILIEGIICLIGAAFFFRRAALINEHLVRRYSPSKPILDAMH